MTNNEELKKNKDRRHEIIGKLLLPDETMGTISRVYGISRQRLDQIFQKETGYKYMDVKKRLFELSENIVCIVCGSKIKARKNLKFFKYCSKKCYKFSLKYDISQTFKCNFCKQSYFRFRNWKNMKGINYTQDQHCSLACYIAEQVQENKWSLKRGTYIKKQNIKK